MSRLEVGYRQSLDAGMRGVRVRYGTAVPFEAGIPGRSPSAVRAGVAVSGDFGDSLSGEIGYQGYMSGRMSTHAFEARLTFKM